MAGLEKCSGGYCEIPGGIFEMGSMNGDPDEGPVRKIMMTSFQLGQTEVSVGQYRDFLATIDPNARLKAILSGCGDSDTPTPIIAESYETKEEFRERAAQSVIRHSCDAMQVVPESTEEGVPYIGANKRGDNFPIEGLTFDQKRAYCRAQGGDLPTAAQLHFASRYDEQAITGRIAIFGNSFRAAQPVTGGYKNPLGVFNLLGNVWESTLDAYDAGFYSRMSSQDPYNPLTHPYHPETNPEGQFEELSGGSWRSHRKRARPSFRFRDNPSFHYPVGFRCARRG